ncbi:Gp37-like protein [Ellagibacter isourolithinifaciens]|uniref:Gp37-like protein n=1 Tax=Ellagibacter isourolithinifaciens TaxID=2137581 RepID=UPI003A95B671
MVLVVHDPERGDLRELLDFELDLAFGSDENAFELTCADGLAPAEGQLVFVDGSEYGGVVDEASYEAGREATGTVTCKGRTWHGVLAGKRLLPDSGSGYLSVSGKAGEVLASLIGRMGLDGLFSAAADDSQVSHTFERFCDGYSGLKALAKANGRKVAMRRKGGKVEISLPPVVDYASKVDSDLLDFTLTSVHRCVNHLVCAGTGELEDRAVVHFYADAAGNVSHTQSLFGVDEIAALYDYSNADEEKLEEEGRKKLQEYQTRGSVEVEAHDDIDVDVGDVISARDNAHGRTVTATVAKKIVKVSRGVATYSYEVGSETTTKTSSSGTAESSGGGHAYFAGSGLTLSNYTFSADVDKAALAAVETKAVEAKTAASNASAAAGKAETAAKTATDAAEANAKAIAGKQDKLTAGANVTIDGATISAKDTTYTEATTSKSGLMSAADKKKLDKAIKSGDELMTTNPSTPGSTLYISKIDNALYAADKRFNVSGKMISDDGAETELSAVNLAAPFAGDYEKQVRIQPGSTMVMRIRFDNQYNGQFPGYPYGYIIVSFYFALGPKSVTVRAYNAYEPQGTGWKALDGEKMSSSSYRMAWRFRNKYYGIQEFEVTIEGAASGSEGRTSLSQIEMHLDRPYSGINPFLSKYAAEELYYPLTAPKFIGDLQGTADAAKTADKATNASSADSASKADRLKTARKVSISGAVNGSATWDGSDDLAITVTGDSAAAGFLAAHPVGFYAETSGADPNDYGGTWERAPSVGPHTWLRTK